MIKLNSFETNPALENEGSWIDIGDGAKLKIAREGNREFKELLKKLSAPHKREIRHGLISEEKADLILCKAIAGGILKGWSGLCDEKGKEIAYTEEAAANILSDPKYRNFRELVLDLSQDQENFRQQEIEESEKN